MAPQMSDSSGAVATILTDVNVRENHNAKSDNPPSLLRQRASHAGSKASAARISSEGDVLTPGQESGVRRDPKTGNRLYTMQEVRKETQDFLIVLDNKVYKLPHIWVEKSHPGGAVLLRNSRGLDCTIPFHVNHDPKHTDKLRKRFYAGDLVTEDHASEMETEFMGLVKLSKSEKWYTTRVSFYVIKVLSYITLYSASLYCALSENFQDNYYVRVLLSAFLMGFFFQQVAFFGHDIGHNAVTHNRWLDEMICVVFGNFFFGISIGWWKATHHTHHLVCNSYDFDPDVQHMPVFAISPKFVLEGAQTAGSSGDNKSNDGSQVGEGAKAKEGSSESSNCTSLGFYSHYHYRRFDYDAVAKWCIKRQHYLYYPIMAVARINLYLQSLIFVLKSAEAYRMRGGNHRLGEGLSLLGFYTWYVWLLGTFDCWAHTLTFMFLCHAVAGLLHVQITISHFPMPTFSGVPMAQKNFVEVQLATTLDVECPRWMDWFHGGLQFQGVHHLFPMLPRHNLRDFRDEHLLPFCKKWEIPYHKAGFIECNRRVIQTLKESAQEISDVLIDGVSLVG